MANVALQVWTELSTFSSQLWLDHSLDDSLILYRSIKFFTPFKAVLTLHWLPNQALI